MKLVDANTLIYAVHDAAPRHAVARAWLEEVLATPESILLPWVSLLAFVRVTTHPRIYERPLTAAESLRYVDEWLARPNTTTPEPDARHAQRVREMLEAAGGRGGNLVNDAHLAALAIQWGATVVTFDRDFGRFPGVLWETPSG